MSSGQNEQQQFEIRATEYKEIQSSLNGVIDRWRKLLDERLNCNFYSEQELRTFTFGYCSALFYNGGYTASQYIIICMILLGKREAEMYLDMKITILEDEYIH